MRSIVLFLLTSVAFAQNGGGTLTGTVSDSDGGAVRNVAVQATNLDTKAVFKATTSEKGEYTVAQLPAGTYELSVPVSGLSFKPYVRQNIVVEASRTLRLDIRLQDGITLNTLGEDRAALAILFRRHAPPAGPTPHTPDGKPDLSGVWFPAALPGDPSMPQQRLEAQPWAEAVAKQRAADDFRDVPSARCLPNGITLLLGQVKFVQASNVLVMLSEGNLPRQVFLDGRTHPRDMNPTWLGHSIGRWEGDTLIVDTAGFNDKTWLDLNGHPHTEMLHVIERYRRPDLGHLEIEMTVEDPGALKNPWTVKRASTLDPNEEIQENLCNENERDLQHLVR